MPLSSLRRRTANEPLPPQEEHRTPSPYRPRSVAGSGLTPRKSLQSIIGSVRGRGAMNKADSPHSVKQDVLEESLYEHHDRARAGRGLYRTPSPHPAKL